jgi:hypothetical protein
MSLNLVALFKNICASLEYKFDKNINETLYREKYLLPLTTSDGTKCKDFDFDTIEIVICDIRSIDYQSAIIIPLNFDERCHVINPLGYTYCDMV